jgi:hypothetical protein
MFDWQREFAGLSAAMVVLFTAVLAVAANFCAGHCDFDGAVLFNLFL